MKLPIREPVKKWAASMTMVLGIAVIVLIAAIVLITALPAESYGTILVFLALFAGALALLVGRVVRWLTKE